jgi:hypothetical protein
MQKDARKTCVPTIHMDICSIVPRLLLEAHILESLTITYPSMTPLSAALFPNQSIGLVTCPDSIPAFEDAGAVSASIANDGALRTIAGLLDVEVSELRDWDP